MILTKLDQFESYLSIGVNVIRNYHVVHLKLAFFLWRHISCSQRLLKVRFEVL
jgi:hypothetical protein